VLWQHEHHSVVLMAVAEFAATHGKSIVAEKQFRRSR